MAGEYYRWLARDVKPAEKRELTREEKIKNWWYYHKWHLLVAAVVIFLVADIVGDMLTERRNQPDYSVAYVGSSYLPDDTVAQLTEAMAGMGEDLNGNGKVQVKLHQYIAYPSGNEDASAASVNYSMLYAAQVQLAADIETCGSYFFLLEDPAQFQADYQLLPEGRYLAWTDCPVLEELPLGEYAVQTMEGTFTGSSREVLSGLYIARRTFWGEETCKYPEGCEALWNRLTQGAGD